MQKRLNLSICSFDCGFELAEGCTSSIVFARWRQYALVEGHVAVTCRITFNHPSTAAMRFMANYFDHLLSLDMPTYTVAQIAKRFEPSTVLWAFYTIQPSSFRRAWFSTIFLWVFSLALHSAIPLRPNNVNFKFYLEFYSRNHAQNFTLYYRVKFCAWFCKIYLFFYEMLSNDVYKFIRMQLLACCLPSFCGVLNNFN